METAKKHVPVTGKDITNKRSLGFKFTTKNIYCLHNL